MTKLGEEIRQAMDKAYWAWVANGKVTPNPQARAATRVAKKYIEKAFTQGIDKQHYEAWAKENGIIE